MSDNTQDNLVNETLDASILEWRQCAVLLTCMFGEFGYSLAAVGSLIANTAGGLSDERKRHAAGALQMLTQVASTMCRNADRLAGDHQWLAGELSRLTRAFITTQVGAREIIAAAKNASAEWQPLASSVIREAPQFRTRRTRCAGALARLLLADIMRGEGVEVAGLLCMVGMALVEISDKHDAACEGCPDCNADMVDGLDIALGAYASVYKALGDESESRAELMAMEYAQLHVVSERSFFEYIAKQRKSARAALIDVAVGECITPLVGGLSVEQLHQLVMRLRTKLATDETANIMTDKVKN